MASTEIVHAQATTDQQFIEMIDLTRADMKSVSTLYSQKKYSQAIDVWRDTIVNRLRRIDFDEFDWHSDRLNGKFMKWAQYLVADPAMSEATYYASSPPYYDYYGLRGKPGSTPAINWLGKPAADQESNGGALATFIMINALPAKYWQSGDTTYLKKYFDLLRDFSTRHKQIIEALPIAARKQYTPDWSSTDAQETLDQSHRAKNIIKELAVIVKSLPGETKISSWDNVIAEVRKPVGNSMAKKIPARQLADIVAGLIRDYPTILLTRFKNAGAVPNQRLNGLCAVLMIGSVFPEFKDSPTFMASANTGLVDYLNTMMYPDGAMLEQSFNYNTGDAGELKEIKRVWETANYQASQSTIQKLQTAVANFNWLLYGLYSPHFAYPIVGNAGHSQPTQLWKDAATATTYTQSKAGGTTSDQLLKKIRNAYKGSVTDTPSFTSVSFPYAGYNVQRNGWHWNSHYLFFNTARAARGHGTADNNAIQVMAYGRNFLIADGQPDYYGTVQGLISKNLGEGSSLKVNTIMVDGYSQTRQPILGSASTSTINTKVFNGTEVDYMEGNYAQGYAGIGVTTAVVKDVTHNRRVVFLRNLGIWLITDLMKNTGTASHTYRQTWNFLPWQTSKNAFGFTNAQVNSDQTNERIYTSDPAGPNILLQQVGTLPNKKYTKYYADSAKGLGFYSYGISTSYPAPDVHVEFSGTGNLALGTIIKPFQSTVTYLTFKDTSDSQNIKMSFTASGEQVRFVSGFATHKGNHFGFSLSGTSYLAIKKSNGNVYGYVLGSDKTTLTWNGNIITHGFTDYQFELDNATKTITIRSFDKPDMFDWNASAEPVTVKTKNADVVWKETVTGIELKSQEQLSINVYPNPCYNEINMISPEPGTMELIDVKGQVIKECLVKNITNIDISGLQSGTYFIRFSGEKVNQTKAFVKQ